MTKKILKISLIILLIIVLIGTSLYFIFVFEKPIDQKALNTFLKDQPIIDVHLHITKGYSDNELYNNLDDDINLAKIKWMSSELKKNNIVIALSGGPQELLKSWTKYDDRYWVGVIFPCSFLVEQDYPCDKEFYNYSELEAFYSDGSFKILGESMFNYYGIPPTDIRLEPYWKIASTMGLPIGIHADSGPPTVDEKERPNYRPDYANPKLLVPILEKYPDLRIYLMHYGGEYSDESIELMKKYPQIYCDMSAVSLFAPKFIWEPNIKKLFKEGLGDRLMFGSDYSGTIRKNIEIVFQLDWLTADQKRDIYYNNAARFLNLSKTEIKKHKEMIQ